MLVRFLRIYFNDTHFLNRSVLVLSFLGIFLSIILFVIISVKNDTQSSKDQTSNDLGNFTEKQDIISVIRPFVEAKIYLLKPDLLRQAYQEYLIMQNPFRSQQELDQKLGSINTLDDYLQLIDKSIIDQTNKKITDSYYQIKTLGVFETIFTFLLLLSQFINAVFAFRMSKLI